MCLLKNNLFLCGQVIYEKLHIFVHTFAALCKVETFSHFLQLRFSFSYF